MVDYLSLNILIYQINQNCNLHNTCHCCSCNICDCMRLFCIKLYLHVRSSYFSYFFFFKLFVTKILFISIMSVNWRSIMNIYKNTFASIKKGRLLKPKRRTFTLYTKVMHVIYSNLLALANVLGTLERTDSFLFHLFSVNFFFIKFVSLYLLLHKKVWPLNALLTNHSVIRLRFHYYSLF